MALRRTTHAPPAAEAPVAAGTVVADFTVQRVLRPSDGCWTVAVATGPTGRPVVLHVSSHAAAQNLGQRERIARLQRLRTVAEDLPLVRLAGAGRAGDVLYVALARPTLRTLADRLREGPMTVEEAARLLSQVAAGLETLRAFGIPYENVTPDRILLTHGPSAQALVAGYGFGPPPGRACEQPDVLAAADYLPPEAAQGESAGPAGTVYALACVLFECLTGAPPYPYDRPLLVLQAAAAGPPPRVSERADVPPELDAVLQAALSPRPDERQASAAALVRDAQRALGQPITVIKAATPPRAAPVPPRAAAPSRPQADEPARPAKPPGPRPPQRPEPASPGPEAPRPAARAEPAAAAASTGPPPDRPRRRVRWPAPAAVGAGIVLLVAATAGFATANLHGGTDSRSPPSHGAPVRAAAIPDAQASYVRGADQAMRRLTARRAVARRQLRSARDAPAQSAAALGLARAYRDARRSLPTPPPSVPEDARLAERLAPAEQAYRQLGAAAQRHDSVAFGAAGGEVVASEQDVAKALSALERAAIG